MKKVILIFILITTVSQLTAQITVNRSHVVVAGQIIVQSSDTNSIQVQTGGTNKTWNFANLKSITKDTMKFEPSQWYPGHTFFPNANIAIVDPSDDSSFTYLKIDNSEISVEGEYALIADTFEMNNFKKRILTFPSTYNTTFSDKITLTGETFPLGFDIDSTGPLPFIDSIRLTPEMNFKSTIEGWGSIVTPLGTYNTLMQNDRNIFTAKIEAYTSGSWINVPPSLAALLGFDDLSDTSYQHQFWTDDASVGFPIVSYSFDQGESTSNSIDWLQTKPQTNSLNGNYRNAFSSVYPNPTSSTFKVKLSGEESVNLHLFDINGKLLKSLVVENGTVVDISMLEKGIYTLSYTDISNGTTMHTQKIVKF